MELKIYSIHVLNDDWPHDATLAVRVRDSGEYSLTMLRVRQLSTSDSG